MLSANLFKFQHQSKLLNKSNKYIFFNSYISFGIDVLQLSLYNKIKKSLPNNGEFWCWGLMPIVS